ncbi:hypothetical protein [Actinacidiphila glaucinigra]|uniref:hypothetical protein n=1 Tax=Actinacidiphila glaucinigra TaxID=235986 RepID=UPI003D90DBE2
MNTRQTPLLSGTALTVTAAVLAITGATLLALNTSTTATTTPPKPAAAAPTAAGPAGEDTRTATASTTHPPRTRAPASPAVRTAAAADPAVGTALPPPGAGPSADPLVQDALEHDTRSALPAATARRLATLAKAVWTADVTGTGRERWPGYFTKAAPQAIYTRFRIQAAVAHRDPDYPTSAVVRLVWAGADPAGTFLDGRTATVRFIQKGKSWTPAR